MNLQLGASMMYLIKLLAVSLLYFPVNFSSYSKIISLVRQIEYSASISFRTTQWYG